MDDSPPPAIITAPGKNLKPALIIFNLGIWAILLLNGLLPMLNMSAQMWQYPDIIPYIKPIGTDFREGYYYPAKVLLQGKSPYVDYNLIYPPFSALFSVPFRLFQVDIAYLVNVCLLFALNIASILLSLVIARRVFSSSSHDGEASTWDKAVYQNTLIQLAVYAITCYGFLFSVERGNMDSYPVFFSLLALWLLTKPNPGNKQLWIATLLIAITTHLKIYPAALFLLVIWKFGHKSLVPIFVTNLGLFFITGYQNAFLFIKQISLYSANPYIWVGNHATVSFASYVNSYLGSRLGIQLPTVIFYLLPILLWGVGAWRLYKNGLSPRNLTWLFLLILPLMNVLPTVSHDYKLVLLTPVLGMLVYWLLTTWHTGKMGGKVGLYTLLVCLIALLFLIGRSPALLPTLLKNKYPFILAIQGITILGIYTQTMRKRSSE